MATQLFLKGTTSESGDKDPQGIAGFPFENDTWNGLENQKWFHSAALRGTRGGAANSIAVSTVAGPTNGLVVTGAHISDAVAAAFTMSGTITFNVWALENSMNANITVVAAVFKLDKLGELTLVCLSSFGTELGTTFAVKNWTASPTSTAFAKGDRIAVYYGIDDATAVNMASGFQGQISLGGPTAGAQGDTYVTFTENITFTTTAPAGTKCYLTDTSVGVGDAGFANRELWTSRGSGVVSATRPSVNGPITSPTIWKTTGGTELQWFTRPLNSFTLSGLVECAVRQISDDTFPFDNNTCLLLEIAICDNDGLNPTVWARQIQGVPDVDELGEFTAGEPSPPNHRRVYLSGPDTVVPGGSRIRFRAYMCDNASDILAWPASSGFNLTVRYGGTSDGTSGDSYVVFTQTITEAPAPTTDSGEAYLKLTPLEEVIVWQDDFERTSSNTWGNASHAGGTYTPTNADFDVAAGKGTVVSQNETHNITIDNANNKPADLDVYSEISFDSTNGGVLDLIGFNVRASTDLLTRIRFRIFRGVNGSGGNIGCHIMDGSGTLIAGLAEPVSTLTGYGNGVLLRVRFQSIGNQHRIKIWRASNPEPSSWTLSGSSSHALKPGQVSLTFTCADTGNPYTHSVYYVQAVAYEELAVSADSDTVYLTLTPSGTDEQTTGAQEYTDSGTAGLRFTPSAVEITETADSDTVYLDLQPSGTESRDIADSDTVPLLLSPSGTEQLTTEYLDTGTVYFDLQPNAIEITETADSETINLRFTPSANEQREQTDADILLFKFTPTATEGLEATDSDSLYLDIVPSGTEERQYTDSDSLYFDLQPSGVEVAEFTDSDTVRVALVPSADEVREIIDAATAQLLFTPSGTEEIIRETLDSGTIYLDLQPDGTETREITDSDTVPLVLTPSAVEIREIVDVETVYLDLQPSGPEQRESTDSDQLYFDLQPSGIEGRESADSDILYLDFVPSGAEFANFVDADSAYLDLEPSGTDEFVPLAGTEYTDSGTVYLDLQPSGTDERQQVDSDTLYFDLQPSGTELREFTDVGTVPLLFTPAATEFATYTDADSLRLAFTPSGTDQISGVSEDSATIPVALLPLGTEFADYVEVEQANLRFVPSAVEFAEFVDTAIAQLLLTPSGVDVPTYTEIDELYLDLQPSGTDTYELPAGTSAGMVYLRLIPVVDIPDVYFPFDSLLVGTMYRRFEAVMVQRWSGEMTSHWYGIVLNRRWGGSIAVRHWIGEVKRRWSDVYFGRGE